MRGKAAALLVAGVVLGSAGTGIAATQLVYVKRAGVVCGFGTGPHGRGVACLRSDQKGYAMTLTHTQVIVWRGKQRVFFRKQP
jgi:hypothetical protein